MSNPTEFITGALPVVKNAGPLYLKLLAMQPDDVIEVHPSELPPSYPGIQSLTGRISRKYGIYFAVRKLTTGTGWKILRVKNLEELKSLSNFRPKQKRMEEKMPDRIFNMSDPSLSQLVDEVIIFATRDSAQMIPRGVTAARLTALGTANEAFQLLPSDTQMVGGITEAVETRQTSYDTLTNLIGNVRTMAQNIFGDNSGTYNRFGFEGMISASDKELVHISKQVRTEAVAHAADLLDEGWDAAFATAFTGAIEDFDDKRDLVRVAEADRKQATKTRILAGNAIYSEIDKICNTGKDVWRVTDPAKHDDYVIYDSPSGSTGEVFILNVGPSGSQVVNTPGIIFVPGTPIKVEVLEGGPFKTWFATNAGDIPLVPFAVTDNGEVAFLVASDIGFGPSRLILKVQNDGMVAGTIKITIG